METETHEAQQQRTEALAVVPAVTAQKIQEGTAEIEPQFVVFRHGIKFVTAQTYKELHKALLHAEELEEQVVEIDFTMEGYPLDCIVQLNRALWEVYGFTEAKERWSFFGPEPPKRLNIKISQDDSIQVGYGEMAPPAWQNGTINMGIDPANPLSLAITGQVKRKFEPAVKRIVVLAERLLKEQSIYRGKAVELDLNYIVTGKFNPTHCAPKFIDVSSEVNLILPKDIELEIRTNIWDIIRNPNYFRRSGVPIKSGVQLDGGAGTGKTMTAYRTAQIAVEHGWTYIYLRTPLTAKTFLTAYRLSQLYGPSVLFIEDNDVLFGKDRDKEMNELLETLDGLTAKTRSEVITIYTTNYPERLNKVFLRSGRVNHEISLRSPDAEAAGRFVEMIGGEYLHSDVDFVVVGKAFENLVPADITNGIDQAKKYCIGVTADAQKIEAEKKGITDFEFDGDILGLVTTDMLTVAAEVVRRKANRDGGGEDPRDTRLRKIKEGVMGVFGEMVTDMSVVKEKTEKTENTTDRIAKKFGV